MIKIEEDLGNRRIFIKLNNASKLTKESIRWGFFELARDLKSTANEEILRKPKGGRVYVVRTAGGRKRRHRASAPGEAHANMTGKLRRALAWKVAGDTEMQFGYGVLQPGPKYASFVEFGTRKMKERPSLRISIRKNIRNGEVHFKRQILKRFEV